MTVTVLWSMRKEISLVGMVAKMEACGLLPVDQRQRAHVVQMGVGDEDGLQFSGYPSVIGKALLAVFFRMKSGIQEKR